jgi:hypothetical protein
MYACMYGGMNASIYVLYMYLSMYLCMHECMYLSIYLPTYLPTSRWWALLLTAEKTNLYLQKKETVCIWNHRR